MTDQNQPAFRPGDTVTVLRGDGSGKPLMFVGFRDDGTNAGISRGYGTTWLATHHVVAWNDDLQAAWVAELEARADRLEQMAAGERLMANLAKLARRNTAIESTGKRLRVVTFLVRGRHESDAGTIVGYWADGYDWTGKRQFIPADGSPSLYLFDDEVLDDEEAS